MAKSGVIFPKLETQIQRDNASLISKKRDLMQKLRGETPFVHQPGKQLVGEDGNMELEL